MPTAKVALRMALRQVAGVPAKLRFMQRAQVMTVLRAHRADIERFGVRSLALFGSTARDEATAESDVDILVEFAGPATFDNCMGLKLYLDDVLGVPVDLVTRRALHPKLALRVLGDAIRVA